MLCCIPFSPRVIGTLEEASGMYDRDGFTTPEEIALAPESFVKVPASKIARIITLHTSGSVGAPQRVYFTEKDMMDTVAFFTSGMMPMVHAKERVAVFMNGASIYTVGGLLTLANARLGAETEVCGYIQDYRDAAKAADRADCLVGLPGQMAALAVKAPHLRPNTVLLSGDYIPYSVRKRLQDTWGCTVFGHWGMTETGYGGGVECEAHTGYHLRKDLKVEIVDPNTGEALPDGTYGEIVITAAKREAMPLFHYRTGDIGCILPGGCACGEAGKRLGHVKGRIGDAVSLRDGQEISIHMLDEMLFGLDGLQDFSVELVSDAALRIRFDGDVKVDCVEALCANRWPAACFEIRKDTIPVKHTKRRIEKLVCNGVARV